MTTTDPLYELGIDRGAIVVLYLHSPREKFWGLILGMNVMGLSLRGIDLNSFDDWVAELAMGGDMTMGLTTLFLPMHRIEKVVLDDAVGAARSCSQFVEERTRRSVRDVLAGR